MSVTPAFIPDLDLSHREAPRGTCDKMGGLPDGLAPCNWPVCAGCDLPMTLCVQLDHAAGRLDLGRPGRRLFVFQCEEPESVGGCETWERDSGANAAFIIEPENLRAGPTLAPRDTTPVLPEVRARGWRRFDEQLALDNGRKHGVHCYDTRVGGEPAWIQHDDEVDPADWRFLAQFSSRHRFLVSPQEDHPSLRRFESGCTMEAANYGGGNAYLFIERSPGGHTPRLTFFWQC